MAHGFDVLDRAGIRAWLQETDSTALEQLWQEADRVRAEHVGDAVHLRGLIEASNYCVRQCAYCGIAACAGPLERYRLTSRGDSRVRRPGGGVRVRHRGDPGG